MLSFWKRILVGMLAISLLHAPAAVAQVSGPGACGVRAVDNESFVTCDRMLLVDIRGREEQRRSGLAWWSDVNVPFMDEEAPAFASPFNTHFLAEVDAALRAARLTHEATVVVLCHSGALGELAAALMAEHGYQRVYVSVGANL